MEILSDGILMVASASLMLGLIHLRMCFQPRQQFMHLMFVICATSLAAYAWFEHAMIRAETGEEYGMLLRYGHIFIFLVLVSMALFVRDYLGMGRRWLLWSFIVTRAISLVLNFTTGVNLNYLEVTSIKKVAFLGESVSVAVGIPNPVMIIGQVGLVLSVVYCIDTAMTAWRRGDRRHAIMVGSSVVVFSISSLVTSMLTLWGMAELPIFVSVFFLGIIVVMAYELSRDLQRAAKIAIDLEARDAELKESSEQLDLSAVAADVGVWSRKTGEQEIHASPKWKELFGFDLSEIVTLDEYRRRIHLDDLESAVNNTNEMELLGNDFEYEFRVVLPSGELRWIASFGRTEKVDGKPSVFRGASVDITKRKLAEESTRELAEIVESSDDAIFRTTVDGVIMTWNRGAEKVYGYTAEEAIGQHVRMIVPEDLMEEALKNVDKIRGGGNIDHLETQRNTKDGRRIHVSLSVSPIKDRAGKVIGASAMARDITRRMTAYEAARKSDSRNRDLLRALPDIIFLQSPDGVYIDCEAPEKTDLLMPPEDFLGKNMSEVLPPELAAKFQRKIDLAMETGTTQVVEYQLPMGDKLRWFEARLVRTLDDRILTVVRDITARVVAEKAVRENEQLLLESQRIANVGSWSWDLGDSLKWTDETFRLYGLSPETFKPTIDSFAKIIHPDDRDFIAKWIEDCAAGLAPDDHEFRGIMPDGQIRYFHGRGELNQVDEDGTQIMTGTVQDITERVRTEQALRESEERFRYMADTAPVLIWISGPDKACTYVNQWWLEFTGRTFQQAIESDWTEGVHPEDADRVAEAYYQAFDDRKKFTTVYRLRRANGEYRWIFDTGNPRFSTDGEFLGYIGSCVDITAQKAAEEALSELSGRLIHAQETERTRVARELHDDLSQSLALLSIQLQSMVGDPEEPDHIAQQVMIFTTQIRKLTSDIHRISHELHPAKLEQLGLEAALRGFCRESGEAYRFKVEFHAVKVPRILPNEVSLCMYRIAQESLQNAAKHSGAGKVSIKLEKRETEIRLVVTDDGIGFDPELEMRKGTLGLISMRERVRAVNGALKIVSAPGKGTNVIACAPTEGY